MLNLAIEGLADVPVVSVGRERRNTDEVLLDTFIFHIRKEQPALLDPFTGAIFVEPVTAEDGRNYEKAHIERWIAQRAAARLAKQEECKKDLIPTPGRFLFAFGRPDVLAARQAERCAKWEWSSEFLAKARPDKAGVGNYGAGDYFDDGLTVLERNQIASGKESFLTGGAKAAYRARTGQF